MTVSSSTRKAGPFNCNGVLTSFPFTFKCFSKSDVLAVLTDGSYTDFNLSLDFDYTVTLNADQSSSPGGTVETTLPYASGFKITILSNLDFLQETDIQNQGGFYPEIIENALDKVTMLIQQVDEKAERAVKVSVSSSVDPTDYLTQASIYADSASASASSAAASANSVSASVDFIADFDWLGAWATSTAYKKNNLVNESGNSYIALADHTSGTFSDDFSNGKWAIFASKGASGSGTGDLIAANNLSEVNPGTARANLSAAKSGSNSDITEITGLTTPLARSQGGVGDTTGIVAKTDVAQAFSKAQRGSITNLTSAANIAIDLSLNNFFSVTLDKNATLDNPTNIVAGQSGCIFITQDATGSRTLAYGSYWDFVGGTAPILSTSANAVDRLDYVVRNSTSIHAVLSKGWS